MEFGLELVEWGLVVKKKVVEVVVVELAVVELVLESLIPTMQIGIRLVLILKAMVAVLFELIELE